jgi:sulfite exporter TauE/SafE
MKNARPSQTAILVRTEHTTSRPLARRPSRQHAPDASTHAFHHTAAWLGAFFGLGGVRGFTTLMRNSGISGQLQFIEALLLFGLGITAMFTLLSALSGWLATRLGTQLRFRRTLFAMSGVGNVAVGLYLLFKS